MELFTSAESTMRLTLWLVFMAVLHESLGYLAIVRQFRDDGIYAWKLVSSHGDRRHMMQYLPEWATCLTGIHGTILLHVTRISAVALLVSGQPPLHSVALWVLLFTGIPQHNRTFFLNGSEVFLRVTIAFLALAHAVPGSELLREAGLWFVAGNLLLGYTGNGWAKLREPSWRRGEVLWQTTRDPVFGLDSIHTVAERHPRLIRCLSVVTLTCQSLFPLALMTGMNGCLVFVAWAFAFHFFNAALFGLNNFVLAFPVGFPALLFVSHRIQLLISGG